MADLSKSLMSSFNHRRQTQVDEVMEKAQRLVNLYHHVKDFNGDFPEELDKMLLETDAAVQSKFSNILGGSVVRQYCEYLKENLNPPQNKESEGEEEQEDVLKQTGYLPSPEEDLSIIKTGSSQEVPITVLKDLSEKHQKDMEEMIKNQTNSLSQLMQQFDEKTHEVATHQTDRLINAISQEKGKHKQYSDIIEAPAQSTVPFVSDDGEGF